MRRWWVLPCAVAVVVAACGSTVPASRRQAALRQQSGEAGLSGGAVEGGVGGGASVDGVAAPGAVAGPGGGAGGRAGARARAAGATAGQGSVGVAPGVSAAPGITDTTITVGMVVAVNSGAANAALGAGGIDAGDPRRNAEVMINEMNARGGIAGRKIVPVFHDFDTTSAETSESQYQAACENFTQDHKVFAALSGGTESFIQCLTRAGVVIIEDNVATSDAALFRKYPTYFELNMNLDRIATLEVQALQAQNYFSGWNSSSGQPGPAPVKVGIVTVDTPQFAHAVDDVLVPALRRLGFGPTPDNIVRVADVRRQQEVGAVAPAVSSAVLRFRSSGVTHVLIFEHNAIATLLFTNNADSQGYRPRYGVTTGNGVQALLDQGAYPRGQLNGIVGIGWFPSIDITPAENPDDGPYSNESRRRCIDLYKRNGVSYDNANAWTVALTTCNSFNLLKLAMESAPAPTRDGFVASMNALGRRFESAITFAIRFDADHHDGAAAYRHWAYIRDCGCMRYTSGDFPVP